MAERPVGKRRATDGSGGTDASDGEVTVADTEATVGSRDEMPGPSGALGKPEVPGQPAASRKPARRRPDAPDR
nr:hypothetical protein [Actinomycetota bacterium]